MAINITDDRETTCFWKNELELTFWVFPDDDDDPVWVYYDCQVGIPLNFIIDQEGIVQYWAVGFNEAEIRAKLDELLTEDVQKASFGQVKASLH
jgi:hypothetical protein